MYLRQNIHVITKKFFPYVHLKVFKNVRNFFYVLHLSKFRTNYCDYQLTEFWDFVFNGKIKNGRRKCEFFFTFIMN